MNKYFIAFFVKKIIRVFSFFGFLNSVVVISGSGGAKNHSLSNLRYAEDKFSDKKVFFVTCYKNENSIYIYSFIGFFLSHFSKVVIADSGIPYSINLKNKISYQTWHGIPLKKIGLKDEDLISRLRSYEIKSMLCQWADTSYVFCPTEYMENILKVSFLISDSSVLKEDTPYIKEIKKMSLMGGNKLRSNERKSILYLPTYRDWPSCRSKWDILESDVFINYLRDNNIICFYKYHPFDFFSRRNVFSESLIEVKSSYFELLSDVDLLITDYSSAYFDAIYAGLATVIYAPDYLYYHDRRGLIDLDMYSGEVNCKEIQCLFNRLSKIFNGDI